VGPMRSSRCATSHASVTRCAVQLLVPQYMTCRAALTFKLCPTYIALRHGACQMLRLLSLRSTTELIGCPLAVHSRQIGYVCGALQNLLKMAHCHMRLVALHC